jgi:soluble lytic murein transglycosylase-like protein
MKKNSLIDSLSKRRARARRASERNPILRFLGSRGAATLALGAMLSVGGLTQSLAGVHFLIEKDLNSIRVVKQKNHRQHVVADLTDGFAGNSVFKLSRALPDKYVTRQISLFDHGWLPEPVDSPLNIPAAHVKRDVFHEEMARINHAIRREFFTGAMPFGKIIHEKAAKYDVDPALVAAVVETESRYRPGARSEVGAQGLMQLMPRTGRWLGARNLYDPEQNVEAGAKYLRYLQNRFDGNLKNTIAAYNAGEGNVKRYGGVPPFRETRLYVKKVMSSYEQRQQQLKDYAAR